VIVTAVAQRVSIQGEAALRERVLGSGIAWQGVDEGEEVACRLGPDALAQSGERRRRPGRVVLAQHRQVEQPLAGVV
jgi:hypothetical protein